MPNIQTAVSPHQLKIGHVFIWTYLLGIVHTTTSFNIYYSSWNILYIYKTNFAFKRTNGYIPMYFNPYFSYEMQRTEIPK